MPGGPINLSSSGYVLTATGYAFCDPCNTCGTATTCVNTVGATQLNTSYWTLPSGQRPTLTGYTNASISPTDIAAMIAEYNAWNGVATYDGNSGVSLGGGTPGKGWYWYGSPKAYSGGPSANYVRIVAGVPCDASEAIAILIAFFDATHVIPGFDPGTGYAYVQGGIDNPFSPHIGTLSYPTATTILTGTWDIGLNYTATGATSGTATLTP